MLRITRQADYGLILLTLMAAEPERVFSAPELASDANLPLPMVSKVLKAAARKGLLKSHRGANGGYSLAGSPHDISVADIVAGLEGPIALTDCIAHGPGECSHEVGCPTTRNWHLINGAIQRALQGISLADMSRPLQREFIPLETIASGTGPEAR
jgi:FeS assembly SUF system regulator